MGKETKIGLAVIGVLMTAFGVLLLRNLPIGQSGGQWEGDAQAPAESIASATANDEPNVVLAEQDHLAGDANDVSWSSPGQPPADPASQAPPTSYMPGETEAAGADRYSIGLEPEREAPDSLHQPASANPFQNQGLDDETAADVHSPVEEAAGEFTADSSARDPQPNPLRRLSAQVPLDSSDEAPDAQSTRAFSDPDDPYAADAAPGQPAEVPQTEQWPQEAPTADDDPFGEDPFAEAAGDEPSALPSDPPGRADDDFGQQPPAAGGTLEPAADQVPPASIADDWQTGDASYEPAPIRNEPLPVENGMYTVQPNDTLWSISEKVYGSGRYFKALAAHNRANLPRSDRLAVGRRVAVPELDQLRQDYPSLCPKPRKSALVKPRAVQATATVPATGGDVYVVQEGDTLFDIARYELGKASRWAEIYELNRSMLGEDFDYLQPGVELRLPAKRRAAEAISRRRESGYLR